MKPAANSANLTAAYTNAVNNITIKGFSVIKRFFLLEFTFSKRLLGVILVVVGVLGCLGLIAFDIIRQSDQGIGPAQRAGMLMLGAAALIGLTLIPLGKAEA